MQSSPATLNHTHTQGNRDNDHIVSLLSQEISWYVISNGWAALVLICTNQRRIYAIKHRRVQHFIMQLLNISEYLPICGWWKTTCVIHRKPDQWKKAELRCWLSSHNRKPLKPVEQMLGEDLRGSLRPEAINQALSASVRLHVMITQQDKYYYWPICKTWQQKHTGTVQQQQQQQQADVWPLVSKKINKNTTAHKEQGIWMICWLMRYIYVKRRLPLGEKKLSWTGDLHIGGRTTAAVVQGRTLLISVYP